MTYPSGGREAAYDVVFYDSVGSAMPDIGRPMGGSERGLMVIAEGLAARGRRVAVVSEASPGPGSHRHEGVTYYGRGHEAFLDADAVVLHRYSAAPDRLLGQMGQPNARPPRLFVMATDVGGRHHDHHDRLFRHYGATLLCVSKWEASTFPNAWKKIVLPPPLPDEVYDRPIPVKDPHKLVYASAAMKGLDATLHAWRTMKRQLPDTAPLRLHVAMGWGEPTINPHDPELGVHYHGRLPPEALVALFDEAAGLFFVNTFPETFCVVAAIAEARGCAMHVMAKEGVGALPTTMSQPLCTSEATLIDSVRTKKLTHRQSWNYRASSLLPLYDQAFRDPDAHTDYVAERAWHVRIETAIVPDKLRGVMRFGGSAPTRVPDHASRESAPSAERWAGTGDPLRELQGITAHAAPLDAAHANANHRLASTRKTPEICLCMMVKNEEATIARALQSARPFIDHYSILLDPETTDRTEEIILRELDGIDGFIHRVPWQGSFGATRTKSLELARSPSMTMGHRSVRLPDYLLVMDADDEVVGTLDKATLVHDGYNLAVDDATIVYIRPHIFRATLPFRYDGIVHEYLTSDVAHGAFPTLTTLRYRRGDGGARAGREKFLWAIATLTKHLRTHPEDTRSHFYLAESYRDAEIPELAVTAYERRARMEGYDEERYWSMYQAAKLMEGFRYVALEDVVRAYESAFAHRTDRIEAIGACARYLTNRGQHARAYVYAKTAAAMPPPAEARLFVEPRWHLWEAKFWLGTIALHLGKKEEARRTMTELLASPSLPDEQRPYAESNLRLACDGLQPEASFPPSPRAAVDLHDASHASSLAFFGTLPALLKRSITPGGSELGLALSLFSLVASTRARRVLEIGRFKGLSTLALAAGLRFVEEGWEEPQGAKQRPDVNYAFHEATGDAVLLPRQLYSVDPHPLAEAEELLREAQVASFVTLIDKRSDDLEGTLSGMFDVVFIDGDHSYEGCLADVRRFAEHVEYGGYLVLHDYFGWYTSRGLDNGSPIKKVADAIAGRSIEPHYQQEPDREPEEGFPFDSAWEHLLVDTGYASLVVFRRARSTLRQPCPPVGDP